MPTRERIDSAPNRGLHLVSDDKKEKPLIISSKHQTASLQSYCLRDTEKNTRECRLVIVIDDLSKQTKWLIRC